ncbi:MAG: GNAT family N-acetyltransferase [Ignavibacteriales bacterium]|nr:GNAT family N-acetyltransferase [Ignavibacteriales bacterium]
MLNFIEINDENSRLWNSFIFSHTDASYSHLYEWKKILEESYSLKTKYFGALNNNDLTAVLPVTVIKLPFNKSIGCSLPFLGCAGLLKNEKFFTINDFFLNVTKILDVKSLEVRRIDRKVKESKAGIYTLKLLLPGNSSVLWENLDPKVRNQIRKAQKSGLTAEWGIDQLDQFYRVYARNMHDLGTPVHSKKFFIKIILYLKENVDILCIRKDSKVIASMFLIKFRDCLSDPWASSDKEYLSYCPNMLMYWEALKYGCENRFIEFDFGRSHIDAGTYKFKTQWGAQPIPLIYDLYSFDNRERESAITSYRGKKAALFSHIWKHIPFKITLWLGPKLRKYIP